jgi:diaminopimelate epimerase
MKELVFSKMVAAGNDFVVIEEKLPCLKKDSLAELSKTLCDRKRGIGADGVLILGKKGKDDASMRIFNADGSEAEMCGNGARCAVWYIYNRWQSAPAFALHTRAGLVAASVVTKERTGDNGRVTIKLTAPKDARLNIPLKVSGRSFKVNFVNTGVPHAVIFVSDLEHINVKNLGRLFRYHPHFAPKGTNVNFVEIEREDFIKVRTYERGVEDETLACGTGVSASSIITALTLKTTATKNTVNVLTQSGEILKVHFTKIRDIIGQVWLEGDARFVFDGAFGQKKIGNVCH